MIKINLSKSILELHKLFFYWNLDKRYDTTVELNKDEYAKIKKEKLFNLQEYNIEDINKIHKIIINNIIRFRHDVSIGTPDKLKDVYDEIINDIKGNRKSGINYGGKNLEDLFYIIYNKSKQLDNYKKDFKFSKNNNKNLETYKDICSDLFGYNSFTENFKPGNNENVSSEELLKVENIIYERLKDLCNNLNENMKKNGKWYYENISEKESEELKVDISKETCKELSYVLCKEFKISSKNILNKKIIIKYWNAYTYAYMTGLKSCPYCNRQHISPIISLDGKMRGDIDHFYSQESYPFFSLSIYNLIPSCKSCNSSFKGTTKFDFKDLHPYMESLDDRFKFKYNLSSGEKRYTIEIEKINNKESKTSIDKYIKTFLYNEQYKFHKDEVEELATKAIIYSDKFLLDLKDTFKLNNISIETLKEQIIGYKIDKDEINSKPLSKLRRDIVNQLGIHKLRNKNGQSLNYEQIKKLKKVKENIKNKS